jgi:MYXO-CTERM domain-containing protein
MTEMCKGMGKVCVGGACVDPCTGVTCPNGGACVNGNCQTGAPGGSNGPGVGGLGNVDPGFPGGITLGGSNGVGAGATGSVLPGDGHPGKDPGCACEIVGQSPAGDAVLVLGGLGAALAMARRRRRAGDATSARKTAA